MNKNLPLRKLSLIFGVLSFSIFISTGFTNAQPFSVVVNGPSEICGTNNTYLTVSPSGGTSFRWFLYAAYPFGMPYTTNPTYQSPGTGYWLCEVTTSSGVYTTNTVLIRTNLPYITAPLGNSSSCNSYVSLREEYSAVNNLAIYSSYQWKKDGNNVTGATSYTYNATSSGSYTCTVTLNCGSGTSNAIPVIINSTIPSNTSITAGGATTFCNSGSVSLSVPNTAGWAYQWKKNATNISGATTYSYTATQTGTYTCTITNICNSVTTSGVSVSVETLPSPTISAGGATTFCSGSSVMLTANSGPYTYQWKNGAVAISGATLSSYSATVSGSFTCEEGNSCGPSISNSINVTVNSAPEPLQAVISAGGATTFCSGGSVVLTATGTGLTYQWKKDGSNISGATDQSYSATTNGSYMCEVGNGCGTTTANSITVTVNQPPSAPESTISADGITTFCAGGSVGLHNSVGGLSYQWKNGGAVIAGATQQAYTATASGSYTCDVSNSCGTTPSNSITVTVNPFPTAAQAMITAGGATSFCNGGSVVLSVAASGFSYQWKNDGADILNATQQSYTASSSGSYTCSVSNACGPTTSNSITVTVTTAPTNAQAAITAGGPTTFCSGGNVTLTVATSGFTYQWKKGNTTLSGATLQSYIATASGNYKCVVSNSCGNKTSNVIAVSAITAPTASVSQASCSGGSIVLTCTASPNTGVTYQWQKGVNILSGATNSTYTATSNGTYKCKVTVTAGGCSKLSSGSKVTITCRMSEEVTDETVLVFPNPSADYFIISTSKLAQTSVLEIFDLTGKLVESYRVSGEELKIGQSLSNGVYFLKIESASESHRVIKLVKSY